jgi:hypothetical protein
VRCVWGGEEEGVGSSSSQDTIDSSLDICKNFLAYSSLDLCISSLTNSQKTRKSDYLSAKKFAKSPTPTDSQEIAHVTALRLVILASRHLCLPKIFADH